MARPKKSENEQKRCIVQFRTTPEEKLQFEKLAQDSGVTLSDLIKQQILSKPPKHKKATPDRAALIRGLAELGKIGSNVNQIAKEINRQRKEGISPTVPAYVIETALHGISMLTNNLRKELEDGH